MVRKTTFWILGIILSISSINIHSQTQHSLMVWGSGGYSSLMTSASMVDYTGNIGGALGLGYEFQYKRFIIHTGAEFSYLTSNLYLNPFRHEVHLYDEDGDPYTANYLFEENKDHYQVGYLNIPLMAGFQFGRLYFLVGGKVGFNVIGKSETESRISTTVNYPQFPDENNLNQIGTLLDGDSYDSKMNLNYGVSAEIGLYLGKYKNQYGNVKRTKYRLAAFADYGIANINPQDPTQETVRNKAGELFYRPVLNNVLLTEPMRNESLNTFFTGLKFTVLFGLKEREECQCDSYTIFNK